jgi:hypothetical protein
MVSEPTLAVARTGQCASKWRMEHVDTRRVLREECVPGHFPMCMCGYLGKLCQRGRQVLGGCM